MNRFPDEIQLEDVVPSTEHVTETELADLMSAARRGEITQARHRLGISQKYLAAHLHVSQSAVSRWETGERAPREYAARVLVSLLSYWRSL